MPEIILIPLSLSLSRSLSTAVDVVGRSLSARKGEDVGDHPPITPMTLAGRESFDHDSWRLYDYIVRHFIGTVTRRPSNNDAGLVRDLMASI